MLKSTLLTLSLSLGLPVLTSACISSGDQSIINDALRSGGPNARVQLCENALIQISDSITFTADGQEISTENYPTGNSRATIQITPGNSAATLISGAHLNNIKIKNIQLDGNRPNAGYQKGGGANIEIGGLSSGQVVSNVNSRNPRGWSCMHIIGSGQDQNPCKKATITNNDIGPCGQSGTDADGNGLWADGVSLDCTDSLVQDNKITGSTDGGIVIFGSPGSTINRNTIIGSDEYLGFGAINMVDGQYDGSYANVKVTNNKIEGRKLFNLGIGIGANVWSFNDPYNLKGPATITGNTISGHVSFPIALNGWENGIQITDNDASAVPVKSSFSDASHCVQPIQDAFNNNANFMYYSAGVHDTKSLQNDFYSASGNMTNFLCSSLPLKDSVTYKKGQLDIKSDTPPFADLHGVIAQYQGDSNIVVLQAGKPVWASGHTLTQGCGFPTKCNMVFQGDGNLVTYYQGKPLFTTNTDGRGETLEVVNHAPWIQIKDGSGNVIWDTTMSK